MQIAIVTGAYKGQGLEWCRQLGKLGYKVILTAREFSKAEQAARELISLGYEIIPKSLTVENESQLAELSLWVEKKFGKIDLIINNAAINPKDYSDKAIEDSGKFFHYDGSSHPW